MASSKKKQEEEHLKLLREMVALPHNKQCFDCHQRGPTYLNMTIGSFICTSCSGLLRGLNPPHRVKSISMASFSADEMEFIKCRGNDFCRKVWLGRYDSQLAPEFNVKDEMRMREMMSQRYDKKRWYVQPTDAMYEEARQQNTTTSSARAPAAKPLTLLVGNNVPPLNIRQDAPANSPMAANQTQPVQRPAATHSNVGSSARTAASAVQPIRLPSPRSPPVTTKPATGDLLADFGANSPRASQSHSENTTEPGGFADFSTFNSQTTTVSSTLPPVLKPPGGTQPLPVAANQAAAGSQPVPATLSQPADKYSAIADLESVFSSTSIGGGFGFQSAGVNWVGGIGGVAGGAGMWGPQSYSAENLSHASSMGHNVPQMFGVSNAPNSAISPPSYSAVAAAPNQFATPVVSGQPAISSNGMQFISQPVNYAGVPQQYVPAGYGFYAPQMVPGGPAVQAGFPVYATSSKQFPAMNGAPAVQGSSTAGIVGAGPQPTAAQSAAGSWPSQQQPVVNPFLSAAPAAKGTAVGTNPFL